MRRAGAVCLAVVLVAGCSGEKAGPRSQGQPAGTVLLDDTVEANDHGSAGLGPGQPAEIAAGDFYFAPTVLVALPEGPEDVAALEGTQLELTIRSESERRHNLSIDRQGFDIDLAPGETLSLIVTFPSRGTLVFVCKYDKERGMAGALVAG